MPVIKTTFQKEAQDRYLTYALSVVSGRALPDVRDGLKPVQRRILYAMLHELNLKPSSSYKKSATIVGAVLGGYHPHGDVACYEAMVRMAQDFSMRYQLVDGQGNFGSLDGDPPAAYRYTEAKLQQIALEVLGEINEETVNFRDNFDATKQEPEVLPSRLPNLLVNGSTGIAVGMATSIPPHNLKDVCNALIALLEDAELTDSKLVTKLKGPDFPTACDILNTRDELDEIYSTGRGAVKMRGSWKEEKEVRGKRHIVIDSIPYAVNKATLVERIGELIIGKKIPQAVDVRDESTEEIRIVLEIAAEADTENIMAFICKNTTLESNFNVNLTALIPEKNAIIPKQLNLKSMLEHFLDFRKDVVKKRLLFEKKNLEARLHILEGFVIIFDALDEAIKIVRKSDGRTDAAKKLQKRFKLTEIQSFAIVDLRIYQLSKTNIDEIKAEQKEKLKRLKEIQNILKSAKEVAALVKLDLEKVSEEFGDARRSKIVKDYVEYEIKEEAFVVKEEVFALVSKDGWIKRIRQNNDPSSSRLREGDSLIAAHPVNTLDRIVFFTSMGNVYSLSVTDFPSSSGYGDPVQKHLKFKDGEKIIASFAWLSELDLGHKDDYQYYLPDGAEIILVSQTGMGFRTVIDSYADLKRNGRRVMKLKNNDKMCAIVFPDKFLSMITTQCYGLSIKLADVLERNVPAVGISLMSVRKEDKIVGVASWAKDEKVILETSKGKEKDLALKEIKQSNRALKGNKVSVQGEILGVRNA